MSDRTSHRPGTASLVATGCGTAIASICAIALFQLERLLGGVWSVAAVLVAGIACTLLARVFARLSTAVPSAAGLLAYFARGFGRRRGVALAAPYLLLSLVLIGAEATIVGVLLSQLVPLPVPAGALLFLVATWAICRRGMRVGYRAQAIATWSLIACLSGLALSSIAAAGARGELSVRLMPPLPHLAHFLAGVGQALFLFMGFELLTSQTEVAASPRAVGRALVGSVAALAAFYALLSLGFSCMPSAALAGVSRFAPQLAIAKQTGSRVVLGVVVLLSIVASFTSFHGALLALSRLLQALAAQGTLPRVLGHVDPTALVPRTALALLLVVSIGCTALTLYGGVLEAAILAAAVGAALIYSASAWVRERAPFAEPLRSRPRRLLGGALAFALLGTAVGVIADAGAARVGATALLLAAFGGAWLLARRVGPQLRREVG